MFTNEERAMIERMKERAMMEREQGMQLIENTEMLSEMNQKQVNVMKNILLDIPKFDYRGSRDYEVKKLEMSMSGHDVYVFIETGMVGDEGTMASLICRKSRHFWIGVRGGLKIVNSRYHISSVSKFDLMTKHYEH